MTPTSQGMEVRESCGVRSPLIIHNGVFAAHEYCLVDNLYPPIISNLEGILAQPRDINSPSQRHTDGVTGAPEYEHAPSSFGEVIIRVYDIHIPEETPDGTAARPQKGHGAH